MARGTIARLMDRGFGFIKTEKETDLFFHSNDLERVEFNSLSEGQEVEFEKGLWPMPDELLADLSILVDFKA